MLIAVGLVVVGLVLLVFGADVLVKGAIGLATLARLSQAVIGLTIVAAGTSMPELVVSVNAALSDSVGLAVGNVVGSNIFNITAILGICAMVRPLRILSDSVRLEWPVMMLASMQLHLLARDGSVDRLEGGFFLIALAAFTGYMVWATRRGGGGSADTKGVDGDEAVEVTPPPRLLPSLGLVGGGVLLLVAGAESLVHGATTLARGAGVSETIIGLTVVAAGTSLPELATSLVASHRGKDDIAVTNIIGSNIFNILFILGSTAVIAPLAVPAEIIERDNWWMLGVSLLLLPLMRSGMAISRAEGAVLVAAFLAYMAMLGQAAFGNG
jgi:cation:H+ antiporter